MGEQMRSHIAALAAMHLEPGVYDIFRYAARTDAAHATLVADREVDHVPGGIRIFHINGDEVERVFAAFTARGNRLEDGLNIVVPAWELPAYPQEWATELRRFDAVWALSRFIQSSLATAGIDSMLVGQSVEPLPGPLLPRRHFGIRESAFVLLNFFDLSSFASRKNPEAVLTLFNRLRQAHPYADLQLVLKAKEGEKGAETWAERWIAEHGAAGQVHVIARPLDTLSVRSLIAACDCFVSLHRAEGFGRGLGEAMALSRHPLVRQHRLHDGGEFPGGPLQPGAAAGRRLPALARSKLGRAGCEPRDRTAHPGARRPHARPGHGGARPGGDPAQPWQSRRRAAAGGRDGTAHRLRLIAPI
jgi:hypothetical protein